MRNATKLLFAMLAVLVVVPAAPVVASQAYDDVVSITFPMPGYDHITDGGTYHACRGSNCSRVHRATDIMGGYGLPVYAAMGGTIRWITGEDGNPPSYGYMISIQGDDGREYSYIHLGRQDEGPDSAYAPGIRDGARVERGQLIGYNGDSGNTRGNPHLHFEIEDPDVTDPYGSNRMDPYDSLMAALERGDMPGSVNRAGSGGTPVFGDWDGNGSDTPGFVNNGTWSLYNSYDATEPDMVFDYGRRTDTPVVGDWDGDGVDTVGVVRGNKWILRNVYRSGADDIVRHYGRDTDKPVVGDWDGNGTDTLGVVRGNRFILRNVYRSGADDIVMAYGRDTDVPVVGDWDGDGEDTLGVVRGDTAILRNVYRSGADDIVFRVR